MRATPTGCSGVAPPGVCGSHAVPGSVGKREPDASGVTTRFTGPSGYQDLQVRPLAADHRQQPVVAGRPDDVGETVGAALGRTPRVPWPHRDEERLERGVEKGR